MQPGQETQNKISFRSGGRGENRGCGRLGGLLGWGPCGGLARVVVCYIFCCCAGRRRGLASWCGGGLSHLGGSRSLAQRPRTRDTAASDTGTAGWLGCGTRAALASLAVRRSEPFRRFDSKMVARSVFAFLTASKQRHLHAPALPPAPPSIPPRTSPSTHEQRASVGIPDSVSVVSLSAARWRPGAHL